MQGHNGVQYLLTPKHLQIVPASAVVPVLPPDYKAGEVDSLPSSVHPVGEAAPTPFVAQSDTGWLLPVVQPMPDPTGGANFPIMPAMPKDDAIPQAEQVALSTALAPAKTARQLKRMCAHGRQKSVCRECGGNGICVHNRRRSRCPDCGGGSLCKHGKRDGRCRVPNCNRKLARIARATAQQGGLIKWEEMAAAPGYKPGDICVSRFVAEPNVGAHATSEQMQLISSALFQVAAASYQQSYQQSYQAVSPQMATSQAIPISQPSGRPLSTALGILCDQALSVAPSNANPDANINNMVMNGEMSQQASVVLGKLQQAQQLQMEQLQMEQLRLVQQMQQVQAMQALLQQPNPHGAPMTLVPTAQMTAEMGQLGHEIAATAQMAAQVVDQPIVSAPQSGDPTMGGGLAFGVPG